MIVRQALAGLVAVAVVLGATGGAARAARARFHYVPVDAAGNTTLQPAGPAGAPGERVTLFGSEPYVNQPRPTHLITFVHGYTGRHLTVPLSFPEGTPRIEHRADRVIYNYGSYTVEVHFLPDGSVDVVYNSGLLRAL